MVQGLTHLELARPTKDEEGLKSEDIERGPTAGLWLKIAGLHPQHAHFSLFKLKEFVHKMLAGDDEEAVEGSRKLGEGG